MLISPSVTMSMPLSTCCRTRSATASVTWLIEDGRVVGPPVLLLLHRVEQLGRPGEAADMGREDAVGTGLHRSSIRSSGAAVRRHGGRSIVASHHPAFATQERLFARRLRGELPCRQRSTGGRSSSETTNAQHRGAAFRRVRCCTWRRSTPPKVPILTATIMNRHKGDHMKFRRLMALCAAAALVVTACGDDDDDAAHGDRGTPAEDTEAPSEATERTAGGHRGAAGGH